MLKKKTKIPRNSFKAAVIREKNLTMKYDKDSDKNKYLGKTFMFKCIFVHNYIIEIY